MNKTWTHFGGRMVLSLMLCLLSLSAARAGNPLVYGAGMADPAPSVYGDRVYLYCTHDPKMKDWFSWSSDNLVDWTQEGIIEPKDTFLAKDLAAGKKIAGCWATCGASRNGKYYWYYCSGDEIGVSVSDKPGGPWKDPLGKPLVARRDYPTGGRDPDVFTDDDGKAYLLFGVYNYHIALLNDDMISLNGEARPVEIYNAQGPGGFGRTDDKPALHKRNGQYYLSWCSHYAVSDNIYGPYTYKGYLVDREHMAQEFHTDPIQDRAGWRGRDDLIRMDRHGGFFQFNNQWYYAVNDHSFFDEGRSTLMGYVHYRDNGEIAPIRLDLTGVGEYDALNPFTQAEDFFKANAVEVCEGVSGGFVVQRIAVGSELNYPRVKNLCAKSSMTFCASSQHGGEIEVREGHPDGKVLGICKVAPTGGLDIYKVFNCKLSNEAGTGNLCLTFKGGAGELMRLDWFNFPDSQACLLAWERKPRGAKSYFRLKVTATSESSTHKAENVIDGDVGTFWTPDPDQALPQSVTVDIGQAETIRGVRLSQRRHSGWIFKDYGIDYISRGAIHLSEDGTNFVKAVEDKWTSDPMMKYISFAPQSARFIRIEALESFPSDAINRKEKGKVSMEEIQILTIDPAK